ncbi:Cdc7p-Dbf4p kinase complex regulatory subunit, partial [Friedmanniomyces endolithicus]
MERQPNLRRSPRKLDAKADSLSKPLDSPRGLPAKRQSSNEGMPSLFGSTQQTLRGLPRMIGGEPVASGLQHSNVTSAIRSQYISSAAISSTAPGANHRIGDSKEVSALKRKVLERGASVNSHVSMPSSYMNDMRAAINNDNDRDPPPRAAKRKAQETL